MVQEKGYQKILTPARFGILVGLGASIVFGCVYIVVLHEPGNAFYWFALLVFLVGPVIAGILAYLKAPGRRLRSFVTATGTVFGIVCTLFIFTYALFIRIYTTKVQIPAFCDGTYDMAALPPNLSYTFPDETRGIMLLSDTRATIVAKVDDQHAARPTTLFLISRRDSTMLGGIEFPSDIVAVAMDADTAYLFHEGLGHLINTHTGRYDHNFLTMDTYGTNTDGFFETTGVMSSWRSDGTVKARPHLTFSGIARGCYISGENGAVVKL
jgi:hypothetical protein